MTAPKLPDADFIKLFEEIGPTALSKKMDSPMAGIARRRRNLERRYGRPINPPDDTAIERYKAEDIPGRLTMAVNDGVVIVGSDLHAWPGKPSTAFRAFLKLIKELQPKAVIMNGDVIDGATISRHPPLGWDKLPTLVEELEAAQDCLHQVTLAAPKRAELLWPCGNHDSRFGIRLATIAPEYAKIHGTHLKDHFGERWKPCWSVWINDGDVVVKHRARGGVHASYTSTLHAGTTVVHGHLHSLKVTPFTDYRKRRYGIDCGTLAEPYGPQFAYIEDGQRNWTSGFAVLTFKAGRLLWPDLCAVVDQNTVEFRGQEIRV